MERADPTTVARALPLLLAQMAEHRIDTSDQAMGPEGFARAVRGLVETPGRGLVLLAYLPADRADPVGVAVLAHTWTIEQGGATTWLDELYVVPELRSHGIGTALLRHAIEVARREGCRAIELEVDVEHERVAGLYERHGFEPFPRRHFSLRL